MDSIVSDIDQEQNEEVITPRNLERRYRLVGIMHEWNTRKVATNILGNAIQMDVDEQLESIVKSSKGLTGAGPTLSEGAVNAMRGLADNAPKITRASEVYHRNIAKDLQRSNYRPSQAQMSQLKAELDERNSELYGLDFDILRLQLDINKSVLAMNALTKLRLEKQKEADHCQSWLSAARLLPFEILIIIFQYCKEISSESNIRTSVLSLSHVCSSWRHAALASPFLWNDLILTLWDSSRKTTFSSLLEFWYGRSREDYLLILSLSVENELDPTTGADIVEALLKRAHLFGVFELTIQEGKPTMTELNTREVLAPLFATPGSFFELRELHFVDHSPPRRSSEFQQITVFQDSPHLFKVNLAMNFVEHSKIENFIAWYQLTDLTIGGRMSFPAFTYIFFECRRLQFAEFFFVDFRLDDGLNDRFIPSVPITFPDLQSLSIRIGYINLTFGGVGFDQVLEKARLPKAHSLCLMNGFYEFRSYDHFAFPFSQFLTLESNRYPLLRNIVLSNADIDVQTLCQFLKLCCCLESLALHLPLPPIEILQALTERKEDAGLSSLSSFLFAFEVTPLHENTEVDLVSDAFGALIASWINDPQHRRPLQEFTLCMCDGKSLSRNTDPVCERVDKRLRQMIREKAGLNIRVYALVFFEDLMDILGVDDPARDSESMDVPMDPGTPM